MSVPERHVVFVPGKNAKPPPAVHGEVLWRCIEAAARGDTPSAATDMRLLRRHFHIVGWNRSYYGRDADIGVDLPWVARMLNAAEPAPMTASEKCHILLLRAAYWLGDRLPQLEKWFADADARQMLEDTHRYFENVEGVARQIRAQTKAALLPLLAAGHEVMLIGHSLGSVIAYDTLWELSWVDGAAGRIDQFLTLGSPLGAHYVRRRLSGRGENGVRRYPANIRHWTNVSADGDVVALDRGLHHDFHHMLEWGLLEDLVDHRRGVQTLFRTAAGPNHHRCYGYFFNPLVARLITAWMRGEPYPEGARAAGALAFG